MNPYDRWLAWKEGFMLTSMRALDQSDWVTLRDTLGHFVPTTEREFDSCKVIARMLLDTWQ